MLFLCRCNCQARAARLPSPCRSALRCAVRIAVCCTLCHSRPPCALSSTGPNRTCQHTASTDALRNCASSVKRCFERTGVRVFGGWHTKTDDGNQCAPGGLAQPHSCPPLTRSAALCFPFAQTPVAFDSNRASHFCIDFETERVSGAPRCQQALSLSRGVVIQRGPSMTAACCCLGSASGQRERHSLAVARSRKPCAWSWHFPFVRLKLRPPPPPKTLPAGWCRGSRHKSHTDVSVSHTSTQTARALLYANSCCVRVWDVRHWTPAAATLPQLIDEYRYHIGKQNHTHTCNLLSKPRHCLIKAHLI